MFKHPINHLLSLPKLDFISHLLSPDLQLTPLEFQSICILNDYHQILPLANHLPQSNQPSPLFNQLHFNWLQVQKMGIQPTANNHDQYERAITQYWRLLTQHRDVLGSKLASYHPHLFIPSHYPSLFPHQRQICQLKYIEMLKVFWTFNHPPLAKPWTLFPPSLFNVTDLPYVYHSSIQHIFPHFDTTNISKIQKQLQWLCRFNLSPYLFLRQCLRTFERKLFDCENHDILSISNSLFLMGRKLRMVETDSKQQLKKLVTHCFDRILSSNQQLLAFVNSEIERSRKIVELEESTMKELQERFKTKINRRVQSQQPQTMMKIVRLLFVGCELEVDNYQQLSQKFEEPLLNKFLTQNMWMADIFPEFVYQTDRYHHHHQKQLIDVSSQLFVTKQKYIDQFQKHFSALKDYEDNHHQLESHIVEALLKDEETTAMMMDSQVKDLMLRQFGDNINVRVEECKYPYKNGLIVRTGRKQFSLRVKNSFVGNGRNESGGNMVVTPDNFDKMVKMIKDQI